MVVVGLIIVGFVCLAAAASLLCGRPSSQSVIVQDDPFFYDSPVNYNSYNRIGATMGYGYSPFPIFRTRRYNTAPPPYRVNNTPGTVFSQQRVVSGNIGSGHNAPPPYNPGMFGNNHNAPPPRVQQNVGFSVPSVGQQVRLS